MNLYFFWCLLDSVIVWCICDTCDQCLPFAMSIQQSQQDNQLELSQWYPQPSVAKLKTMIQLIVSIIPILYKFAVDQLTSSNFPIPYHTSALSKEHWVHELLNGHPDCIYNDLSVCQGTFYLLVKTVEALGLQSSCHISIEEQLLIFLYTMITRMGCTHVKE